MNTAITYSKPLVRFIAIFSLPVPAAGFKQKDIFNFEAAEICLFISGFSFTFQSSRCSASTLSCFSSPFSHSGEISKKTSWPLSSDTTHLFQDCRLLPFECISREY
jgi:hypothetical protein